MGEEHYVESVERVIELAEDRGWEFAWRKYFIGDCPCGSHMRTIQLSPSDPNYGEKLANWLRRQTCWR